VGDLSRAKHEERPVARLRGITKRFPGVVAVDEVDLDIRAGEVHVVAGENGAGKSTLMKVLSQVEAPDAGEVTIDGEPVAFHGPRHARHLGVAMVYQEFALAPDLSVAENLFLGREEARFGFLERRRFLETANDLLRRVGLEVDPGRPVSSLSVAEQQRVEIAKALSIEAKVVIMDEPTASLTEHEIGGLFELIEELTGQGIAVLYISHRLDEIFRIADRVTVMRDGKAVATHRAEDLDEERLVREMVGRKITNLYPKPEIRRGEVVLRAQRIARPPVLHDCTLAVHAGEIVGLAGLVGAGRTELARAIFGADPISAGRIELDGSEVSVPSPRAAIKLGIGYLTEDRRREGLALLLGVDQNVTLAKVPTRGGLIDLGTERERARARQRQLDIRTPSLRRQVRLLSGGNQQKVVVAKWLETEARVLLFDEPARGIDVGAKAEVFALIGDLAKEGRAIVLISSYLPELINMSDRILVMREGRTVGELERSEFSEERIIALATGLRPEA
jgi:ribose transport system ATP-binding protein